MAEQKTCCFSGHREQKLPWHSNESDPRCVRLKQMLYDAAEAVYADGVRHYIIGMASGCDLYFLEAVLLLREKHPELTIEAAIPYEGQADRWRESLRNRYASLLRQCDYQTLVQQDYSSDCMMRRNRYMVDHADVLIAAYSGEPGGTMKTMLYAMRRGLNIIEIPIPMSVSGI